MKISVLYQYPDFINSTFFKLIESESKSAIKITHPKSADIVIYGPFCRKVKTLGPFVKRKPKTEPLKLKSRKNQPINVFHSIENARHNSAYDYSISFDFSQDKDREFRFPYWMESIDWEHEGIAREKPRRLSEFFKIDDLMSPLGNGFTKRNQRCAAIFGQKTEPRMQLIRALQNRLPIDGYGRAFNPSIKNSQLSGFNKDEILRSYSYNLCPENSLYPGYYTEKILEAFGCGCLPISWADPNVTHDFNENAFINLLPYASEGYVTALDQLRDSSALDRFTDSALLTNKPSLEPLRDFIRKILEAAR